MKAKYVGLIRGLALLCASAPMAARATTAALPFSDHMVLQRRFADPVWGTGQAGESVTVKINGQTKTAIAAADGKWQVKLDPMEAGGPYTLAITGKSSLSFRDVMVGEVWIAGGQSNMDKTLGENDTSRAADFPGFRYLHTRNGDTASWAAVSPATAPNMSSTAFYFGRNLHLKLKMAVGIIIGAQGSTYIQRWTDPKSVPADGGFVKGGDLFYGYLGPTLPYGVKGAVYYQGEADAREGFSFVYPQRLNALVRFWRKAYQQENLPFLVVQLPNFHPLQTNLESGDSSFWAEIRDGQRRALDLPNTAMTVNIDIGEANNIHPGNKSPFGYRLSLAARALWYGETDLVWSGPLLESVSHKGTSGLELRFKNRGGGLVAKGGGALKGFAVAGADAKWAWAEAIIQGGSVMVSSASVPHPTQVRYAWADNPIQNLYNAEGLPASPFRADATGTVPVEPAARLPHRVPTTTAGTVDALGRTSLNAGSEPRRIYPLAKLPGNPR